MRLTAKERVLLHLLECGRSAEDAEVPRELAQEGVARGAGIELRHFAQFVRPLIDEGLVRERRAHVAGVRQRRKVYALTSAGRATALRLREKVATQVIRVRDGDAVRVESFDRALKDIGSRGSLLQAIRQVQEAGVLDLEMARHPPEPGCVEHLLDAPRIGEFVGRQEELEEVLAEEGEARMFVVSGVAGIGKSMFAARVCELLRGRRNLFWHRIRPWESDQTLLGSLGRFLEALDRPGLSSVLKRGQVAQLSEVLRQDLPDTHAMLVFDDAHEASTQAMVFFRTLAEAVAPATDVRVLLLTRRRLSFYDVRDVSVRPLIREMELRGLPSDQVARLLVTGERAITLAGVDRGLASHPLFIDLVRSHHYDVPRAIHDVERFLDESIYRDLSEAEKRVMKAASLYRVPVPKQTLLSIPGSSYETLATLQDRCLIRFVGGERFEMHDTVRGFFEGILTAGEREAFARVATRQLQALAAEASASGNRVAAVACLSNALQVTTRSGERGTFFEMLGDANQRLGDVVGASAAYRQASALVGRPEDLARLHRKTATMLADRGYLTEAEKEVNAGLEALRGTDSGEQGWLAIVQARVAEENYEFSRVEQFAESALRVFDRFPDSSGRARALYEASMAALWTGAVGPDGSPLAEGYTKEALGLADALHDPVFEAQIRIGVATALLFDSSKREQALEHLLAIERSPVAMGDPNIRALYLVRRAWYAHRISGDMDAEQRYLAEAERVAEKIHNTSILAHLKFESARRLWSEGRHSDAARLQEEAGSTMASCGAAGFAADAYFCAAMSYVAIRDWNGYERVATALHSPPLARALAILTDRPALQPPLDALMKGDIAGFDTGFGRIMREAESAPSCSMYHEAGLWRDHYYFSLGLRALGREREAMEHHVRALELVHSYKSSLGTDLMESDYGNRITAALRSRIQST